LEAIADTPQGLTGLKQILRGELSIPGLVLRPLDRWNIVTALLAHADPESSVIFAAEKQRDLNGDGAKYAYAAEAAKPDSAIKQRYFNDFLNGQSRPEDWIEQSLYPFNYWSESQLTAPYLQPALQALPKIKQERKIFFLVDWLDAFIDGQDSPEAQASVYAYLRTANTEPDLRLKILQAVDELDRTVAIRKKFAN
jgi:aminopeptidase N